MKKVKVEAKLDKAAQDIAIALILAAIETLCDSECPECHKPIDLPSEEQIEKWLRGKK